MPATHGHKAAPVLPPGATASQNTEQQDEAPGANQQVGGGGVCTAHQKADIGVLGEECPQSHAKDGCTRQLKHMYTPHTEITKGLASHQVHVFTLYKDEKQGKELHDQQPQACQHQGSYI